MILLIVELFVNVKCFAFLSIKLLSRRLDKWCFFWIKFFFVLFFLNETKKWERFKYSISVSGVRFQNCLM